MKSLLNLIFLMFVICSTSAQIANPKIVIDNSQKPVMIINDQIIAGKSELNAMPKTSISEMKFLKDKALGSKVLFADQENPGVITLKSNDDFVTKSQSEINDFFGLDSDTDIYVNGYLIENKNLKLLSSSIAKVEVLKKDYLRLKTAVLNISLN